MQALLPLLSFIFARSVCAAEWSTDVTSHFVEPHTREGVKADSSAKSKPAMVIVMTSWCSACAALRASVNDGTQVKPLLDKFTVAYSMEEGAANVWTEAGQDYVPQVYFFDSAGSQLHVHAADNEKYKYFFSSEVSLAKAMTEALALVAKGSVGAAREDAGPVEGAQNEKDKQTKQHIEANQDAQKEQKPVFDPSHAFDEIVAGHVHTNLSPEDIRQKAADANRPFMVLLSTSWCEACKDLIHSINAGKLTKDLLKDFVVMHAHGKEGLANWQPEGEDYVPQALFFDPDGTLLSVKSKYDKFKHFFSNDEELGSAMAMALDESKAAREL